MRIDRTTLERLPILACAGFIAALFVIQLWNVIVERNWPRLHIHSADPPLAGVEAPTRIPRSLDAFLAGETQKIIARNVWLKLPIFYIAARGRNQFLYSLLGVSGAPSIVVGREGQLLESSYIVQYCRRRGAPPDATHLTRTAGSLARIGAAFEAQGKRFAYLIAPSKAARFPQYVPRLSYCPALDGQFVDTLVFYERALADAKARFVSGASIIRDRQKDFDMPLFPRGGIHWNDLAAALALRDVTTSWRADGQSPVGDYDFAWTPAPFGATGPDSDLLTMMNLLWPDNAYPTPNVTGAGHGGCSRTARLVALGDSFLDKLLVMAAAAPCPPDIDYWFYMRTPGDKILRRHYHRAPGAALDENIPLADEKTWLETIAAADGVILEENEAKLFDSKQLEDVRAHFDPQH